MFWAPCCLGYLGFLCALEFTVPNLSTFSVSLHLSIQDVAVNSSSAPSSVRIRIKGSKTHAFQKGCFVHTDLGRHPLCAIQAMMSYLGRCSEPLDSVYNWAASHLDRSWHLPRYQAIFRHTVFASELPPSRPTMGFWIIWSNNGLLVHQCLPTLF